MFRKLLAAFCALAALPAVAPAAARLKELVSFEGMRDNQLIGYGLVVGLAGTGDRRQTVFPVQSLANLLERMGVTVPATALTVKNTAAVMVTGVLPAFAQPGTRIDVTVAAMGDAPNLQGGLLLLSNLRAPNGQTFAVAQGAVITGGFSVARGGTGSTVNHPTVGRVPNGAIVERAAPSVSPSGHVHLQVHAADFATAARIAQAVNQRFAGKIAIAENSALVNVAVPASYSERPVEFMADLEALTVEVDRPARIVINERTGTIILGKEVRISPVAILHGNLSVQIETTLDGITTGAALGRNYRSRSEHHGRGQGRESAQCGAQERSDR